MITRHCLFLWPDELESICSTLETAMSLENVDREHIINIERFLEMCKKERSKDK